MRIGYWSSDGCSSDLLVKAMVSIPAWSTQEVVLAPIVKTATHEAENRSNPNAPILPPPPTDRKAGNAFVDNLDLYEPIYAVYGPGTDSEARIQLSFKYRLFGDRKSVVEGKSVSVRVDIGGSSIIKKKKKKQKTKEDKRQK